MIFFENDIRRGNDFLIRFSDILLTRLQKGDQVEIFIKGFYQSASTKRLQLSLGRPPGEQPPQPF
jgi:hypothetical protein